MKIDRTALIVAAAMAVSISSATAQAPEAPLGAEDIVLQRGFSELIELPGNIENLAVGDPSIVDAAPMTANTFLLNAIEEGTTNILVLDPDGKLLYRARVHVRPVDTWPNYRMRVTYGTTLAGSYTCSRDAGCPPLQAPAPLPDIYNITGDSVTVNATANAGAGAASGQAAPAPAAPASE